jgi:hypothetical protein
MPHGSRWPEGAESRHSQLARQRPTDAGGRPRLHCDDCVGFESNLGASTTITPLRPSVQGDQDANGRLPGDPCPVTVAAHVRRWGSHMNNTIVGFGIAAIAAAIVGGGLKAFGFELPIVSSAKRQAMLAAFGILLIVAANFEQLKALVYPARMLVESKSFNVSSGATSTLSVRVAKSGPVEVTLLKVEPGRELHVTLCSSTYFSSCISRQIGPDESITKSLPVGVATVKIFNFGVNPDVRGVAQIRYPN